MLFIWFSIHSDEMIETLELTQRFWSVCYWFQFDLVDSCLCRNDRFSFIILFSLILLTLQFKNAIYFVLDTFLRKMIGTLELTSAVLRCLLLVLIWFSGFLPSQEWQIFIRNTIFINTSNIAIQKCYLFRSRYIPTKWSGHSNWRQRFWGVC